MKIKRFFSAITACAAMLCAVGCGSAEPEKPLLKIGCNFGYPPFEYYSEDKEQLGIDIELGKALAEKMGMKAQIVETAWEGILEGLDKDNYDCVISAVTITDRRTEKFDFSDPYITNYQCIMTRKDAEFKPTSPKEIAGLKIGVQDETTSDAFIKDYALNNGIEFTRFAYATASDVFSDLEAGRLDALVCDSMVAENYLKKSDMFEMTWVHDDDPEQFGVCVKKGSGELLADINSALAELKADGTLDEIMRKYF